MRLALFQPDIPQNVGAVIRLCACFSVPLEVIEPTAFPLNDRSLKRAALDYGPLGHMTVRPSWEAFLAAPERDGSRLVLLTTRGATPLDRFSFEAGDTLLFGRESAGVPEAVHAAAGAHVVIPIAAETRSLNLAVSAGIALWEALRQTSASSPLFAEKAGS
jgi:tRNA (cytidine/uridine-2'-O-)-methyltransferase